MADRDASFVVDSTQAITVLELQYAGLNNGPQVLLVLPTNVLIEHSCSTRAGPRIPWEEWGNGAVVTEIPTTRNDLSTFVHGTHLTVVVCVNDNVPEYRLQTFDFSKRGCHALPLWSGEGGGTERRSALERGRELALEGNEGMFTEDMLMPGDGVLVYMDRGDRGTHLYVWEVM